MQLPMKLEDGAEFYREAMAVGGGERKRDAQGGAQVDTSRPGSKGMMRHGVAVPSLAGLRAGRWRMAGEARRVAARVAVALAPALLAGCGYTEFEWQAQLDKQARMQRDLQSREQRIRQLEEAASREGVATASLADRVRAAGLDPEHLDAAAEATARQRDASRSSLRTDERRSAVLKAFLPLATGEIGVTTRRGRIVISIPSQLLFKAGRDALAKPGEKTLRDIAALIRGDELLKSLTYQVVGHTASGAPTAPWRNSWDLTLAQARAVLFFLVQEQGGGLPVAHWSVAGFADMDPVEPGGGAAALKNQRCEIVVDVGEGE
jgi:chemotaxis protein MotB